MRVSGVFRGEGAIRLRGGGQFEVCEIGEVARGDAARGCGRKVKVSVRQVVGGFRRGRPRARVAVIAVWRGEGVKLCRVRGVARRVVQGHGGR